MPPRRSSRAPKPRVIEDAAPARKPAAKRKRADASGSSTAKKRKETPKKKVPAKKAKASPKKKVAATKKTKATKAKPQAKPKTAPKKPTSKSRSAPAPSPPKPAEKPKKPKKPTIADTPAYKNEKAVYDKLYEEFAAKQVPELKDLLRKNDMKVTGNKHELLDRCADGKQFGALPRCPKCSGGKLRVKYAQKHGHGGQGQFSCPGYMDDEDFVFCHYKGESCVRPAWQD
eukprot:m.14747 g.14747  ORF g.14747 m.14747 type:complete len:229 (-) comp9318_c0_seq1:100-786(-)